MATQPVHVRVGRIAFWSGVVAFCLLMAVALVAVIVWLLVVDWQVLGL